MSFDKVIIVGGLLILGIIAWKDPADAAEVMIRAIES